MQSFEKVNTFIEIICIIYNLKTKVNKISFQKMLRIAKKQPTGNGGLQS